jgi:dihydroflavonol-4-reductase
MTTTVIGGGGFLGLNLIDALAESGIKPLCVRRARGNVLGLLSRRVPMVVGDLSDSNVLAEALKGTKVVYHLAGHYPRTSLHRQAALDRARSETQVVLDASARAGVQRLIYVSSTATVAPAEGRPSTEADRFPSPPGLGVYHDVKWAMEDLVDREDRLHTITVCPSACLGPHDLRVGTSGLLVALARGMDPAYPRGLVSVVDVRDVAEALVRLGTLASFPSRLILSAKTHDLEALMTELARHYGVSSPGRALSPEAAIRFSDEEEERVERDGGRAALPREIADLIIHGVHLDGSFAENTLGFRYRPLTETLQAFGAWATKVGLIGSPKSHREEVSAP